MAETAVFDEVFGDITEPVLTDEALEDALVEAFIPPEETALDADLYRLELRQSYRLLWMVAFSHWVYFGLITSAKEGFGFNSTQEETFYTMIQAWSFLVWAVFMIFSYRGQLGIRSSWWLWWITFLGNAV